jgi:hypothetical protein
VSENNTTITHLSWGHIEVTVNGRTQQFKDCKVWPGGATDWDWIETGTHHKPGIQPADIEEVLDHDIDIIILSRGMQLRLHTAPETKATLHSRGIVYRIEATRQAVELFNRLARQGKRVGGMFHSTC